MIALMIMVLASQPLLTASEAPNTARLLGELFQLSDEYRQCLILDKSRPLELRDTYFAEGGRSAENLDLMLSDRQDRLLKRLIKRGKSKEIIEAIERVEYIQVNDEKCRDFDPYYGPALTKLEELERSAGAEPDGVQVRSRPQHWRR
ncbi:hypothetical protein EWE75_23625 [Sphingomonas populi]|uniref:Uncharacterized protein n=1 Tax=Sphingomonas populi TaxID=2484750 RepID=A0A4Q6XRG9_9SPHN|nr:hypothetical protein [Sphingomonas populi]RZF59087.1 hypothetical protein EWE75_23625 [Sphingomonas populi]